MKLHFYGGARIVTGVNYLLETDKSKILVDCGFFQGSREVRKLNREPFSYKPEEIEAVLVTHAHIDHIGRIPDLIEAGFKGKIFCTEPTKDLARVMLLDSEELSHSETEKLETIQERVEEVISLFNGVPYGEKIKLNNEISFQFRDAGHILGSAIIEVWADNKKVVFSGDLGNPPVPILRATEFIDEADYVVVESAYGDRIHETKYQRRDLLEDAIEDTVGRGGVVLIPSFALERTQEILYELNDLVENHRIPSVPVFVDSPLAIDLIAVYKRHSKYFNQEATYLIKSGDDLFRFPGLKMTATVAQSKKINDVKPPKIIIAGSGMSTGGRILHHELRYLSDPNSTLLIVCYQVSGTLGRKIINGAKNVRIFGQSVPVNLRIKPIGGYSAHADQEDLFFWVKQMIDHRFTESKKRTLKKVFVVQGEEEPAKALAQKIKDHLGISAIAPKLNQSFTL